MHWLISTAISAIFVGTISLGSFELGKLQALHEIDQAVAEAKEAQRTKEAELQASMDKLREDKRRETAKLQRTVAALTLSLRDRPERPAVPASATDGNAGGWCSGPQLYRGDAQLALSEAERADTIRLALIACQDAYKAASKQTLEH